MADREGALFVDGANWSLSLANMRLDYRSLVYEIQQATGVKITGLHYYTTFQSQDGLDRRLPFLNHLRNLGWAVIVMKATEGCDGVWRDKEVDISIALDAYEAVRSGYVQDLIIGSGDGDFAALFRRLPADVGKWVVGFKSSLSTTLKDLAKVVLVEDLNILIRN